MEDKIKDINSIKSTKKSMESIVSSTTSDFEWMLSEMEYDDYPDIDGVIDHYVSHRDIFLNEYTFSDVDQYDKAKKMHDEHLLKRLKYRFKDLFFDNNIEDPDEQ